MHNNQLGQVAKDMVGERAPPLVALSVNADATMRSAESEQRMNFQVSASLNDCASDETSLRNTNEIDLFPSEVGIVVQLVTNSRSLPFHTLKHRRVLAISNLNTLHYGLAVNRLRDHV